MSRIMDHEWSYNKFGDILCEDGYTIFAKNGANNSDVRLAAAAPEMYYLLKDLTEELKACGDDVKDSLMIETERLLSRIEGKKQESKQ